jgi:cytochrome c oxidase cbb3-type subunit 1
MLSSDIRVHRVITWFLGSSVFWLLFGTSVGEYVGVKFVAPDVDAIAWLSFGRLRPVHTNAVFWGWASMAMIGLSHYVVPRVCGTTSRHPGIMRTSMILINLAVVLGSISLMMGINNGGGEYREYIWPIASLFALGVVLSFVELWSVVAHRTTTSIHVSAWYMLSAHIFVVVITVAAYLPFWQNGIGEIILQGYYMHQGVGMWFMMCTLGVFYYFIPLATGGNILSSQMGKIAFWSQIVFYTLIGTHHFVFSAIPWWLQIVAILGSVGMVVPVVLGTVNLLACYRGRMRAWWRGGPELTLFVAVLFYVTGSLQGTAEAFQSMNLMWHFTDYTTAHSHLTMYGIISLAMMGCMWLLVRQHGGNSWKHDRAMRWQFRLAVVGLLVYCVPLMIGGSLRGLSWMSSAPFIDSVTLMVPYWTWRAVGGTMMWASHIVFATVILRGLRHVQIH